MQQEIFFNTEEEQLAGLLVSQTAQEKPQVLFLHGAGIATKERALPIATYLLEKQHIPSFLFDFSGQGKSSGQLEDSSLIKRFSEAEKALQYFDLTKPISLLAFSMGGHIALELLNHYPISNLILFYPAIYTEKVFDLPFNLGFTELIRQPESWKDATVVKNLEKFTGNLLIVVGEHDEVIPAAVIEMIYEGAPNATHREVLRIPDADHQFLVKIFSNTAQSEKLFTKISQFLTS